MKKKILFLIHDLHHGGAEKVLVNLVNNMDRSKFDITVMALFGGGVNEQFLAEHIRLIVCHKKMIRGNSHIMKLFTPKQLYRYYIKERYDIIVSYLEGPSARIVSGCDEPETKLVTWIHIEQKDSKSSSRSFRSVKEAINCYNRFDTIIGVSETVKSSFMSILPVVSPMKVLYNTNESAYIREKANEAVDLSSFTRPELKLVGVGKLLNSKGFDRMIRILARLKEDGLDNHLFILGNGPEKDSLVQLAESCGVSENVTFLGYQTNPYKYVSKCDLFICASHAEGFSTAATEALIVGTPVCTVEVSGMKEMLGENNEWGIVTDNDDEALYEGMKKLLSDPQLLAYYKERAAERGKTFSTENTVKAVENMLLSL